MATGVTEQQALGDIHPLLARKSDNDCAIDVFDSVLCNLSPASPLYTGFSSQDLSTQVVCACQRMGEQIGPAILSGCAAGPLLPEGATGNRAWGYRRTTGQGQRYRANPLPLLVPVNQPSRTARTSAKGIRI